MTRRTRLLLAASLLLVLLAARGPLHAVTWALPVSNDDAIPLLMARHVLQGEPATILWNQPYNGTLDTYLLAPLLAVFDAHAGFRVYEAVCGLLLIAVAAVLAGLAAGEAAAWAAALLAALGTPYMALMAATGPTPNFLMPLVTGLAAIAGLQRLRGRWPSPLAAWAMGVGCGLAVWNSALALPALLGITAGLVAAGLRPRLVPALTLAAGFVLGAGPLLVAAAVGASGSTPVTSVRPRWLWLDGMADLGRAAAGLFGVQVPLVVDGPERAALPSLFTVALPVALLLLALAGARHRRAWPLVGWALLLAAAFAASRRTGADEVRYLFGLTVPVLALCGIGLASLAGRARERETRPPRLRDLPGPLLAGLVLLVSWSIGHRVLLRHWKDPRHAAGVWQVPPLDPVLDTLRRAGVTSAYASLQFAARLTLESEETVLASQAWNERIPGDPLRFRDEVDLDPRAAWVLSHHLSRGMPRAGGFRALLAGLGGSCKEDLPGEFAVFRRFVPPYDEGRAVPPAQVAVTTADGAPLGGTVLDRDPATWWTAPAGLAPGAGLALRLTPARRVAALALLVDLDRSPLAVPWVAEAEGALVARGPARHGLQWVNGVPRAGKQALLVVPL
ncbi:MAG TPA: hypothetical protein VFO85_02275, partial [Vicinamibacteria bacterium]|nr:hypothetical protein [Vicinamibacteria bacterium]